MNNADFWVAVMEAEQAVEWGHQALDETQQQIGSETALFGDAWPGAQQELADARREVAEDEATLAALLLLAR